ncbi:hypothetical protein Tco_1253887 [Tanacetum coccineum]
MEPLDTIHQSVDADISQLMDPDTHIDHGSVNHVEPDIIFPVIAPRSQVISQQAMKVMKHRSELKLKMQRTKEKLNEEKKDLQIARKKFTKRQIMYKKYCSQNHSVTGGSQDFPVQDNHSSVDTLLAGDLAITSVALYCLGNIIDERLNRMFQAPHVVQWMRPGPQEDCQV